MDAKEMSNKYRLHQSCEISSILLLPFLQVRNQVLKSFGNLHEVTWHANRRILTLVN